jgi:hypothetical protein
MYLAGQKVRSSVDKRIWLEIPLVYTEVRCLLETLVYRLPRPLPLPPPPSRQRESKGAYQKETRYHTERKDSSKYKRGGRVTYVYYR